MKPALKNQMVFCEISGAEAYTKTKATTKTDYCEEKTISLNKVQNTYIVGLATQTEEIGEDELAPSRKLEKLRLVNVEKGDRTNKKVLIKLILVTETGESLGKGRTAIAIEAVRDETGEEKALKIVAKNVKSHNEVLAMLDVKKHSDKISPKLVCIAQYNSKELQIFMEKISNCITLLNLMNHHIGEMFKNNSVLAKRFIYFIFSKLLSNVDTIHCSGWCHKDLHSNNILIEFPEQNDNEQNDEYILVRIIDYGMAKKLCDEGKEVDYKDIWCRVLKLAKSCDSSAEGRHFHEELKDIKARTEPIAERLEVLKGGMAEDKFSREDFLKVIEIFSKKLSMKHLKSMHSSKNTYKVRKIKPVASYPKTTELTSPIPLNTLRVPENDKIDQLNGAYGAVSDDKVTSAHSGNVI